MPQALLIGLAFLVTGYTGSGMGYTAHMFNTEKHDMGGDVVVTDEDEENILWLARVIFSETKVPDEMRLVGWVVRNRVENGYWGNTYEKVALSPYQFSGLNPSDSQYQTNIHLGYATTNPAWRNALEIAKEIYFADDATRPFGKDVLHFYSPVSVSVAPAWAKGATPDQVVSNATDGAPRFAFYSGVQ
jgi:hypothetical protein